MPTDTRFPEHGFMAIGKAIGQAVGSDDGERPNMGVWITPQASYTSRSYQQHAELYLSGPITTAKGSSTNNLLNLSDSRAQDFFFGQFEELILTFNCSRIWFDYSKCSRSLCVSFSASKRLHTHRYAGATNPLERARARGQAGAARVGLLQRPVLRLGADAGEVPERVDRGLRECSSRRNCLLPL